MKHIENGYWLLDVGYGEEKSIELVLVDDEDVYYHGYSLEDAYDNDLEIYVNKVPKKRWIKKLEIDLEKYKKEKNENMKNEIIDEEYIIRLIDNRIEKRIEKYLKERDGVSHEICGCGNKCKCESLEDIEYENGYNIRVKKDDYDAIEMYANGRGMSVGEFMKKESLIACDRIKQNTNKFITSKSGK